MEWPSIVTMAIFILFAIFVCIYYNYIRTNDLRKDMNNRFADMHRRFDYMNQRIAELNKRISEIHIYAQNKKSYY